MKKTILLCLFLVYCFSLMAQENKMEKSLTYHHYGVRDGLVQAQVFYSFQDSYGYLWFSTNNGVSRFDGKVFKNYVKENALTMDGRVKYIDQYQDIVFFLSAAGLSLLHTDGKIEKYELPDNYKTKGGFSFLLKDHSLYIFNCDKERDLGSYNPRHFFVFDFLTRQYTKSTYKVPFTSSIFDTPKGILITSSNQKDVSFSQLLLIEENNYSVFQNLSFHLEIEVKIDNRSFIGHPYSDDRINFNYIFSLEKDTFTYRVIEGVSMPQTARKMNQNSIYIYSTFQHNSFIVDSTRTPRPLLLETPIINHALVDRNNHLWLSTEEGIYNCYNLLFESYKPGISRNESIWDVKKDVFGNIWFSLYGHGIWRADTRGNLQKADYIENGQKKEIIYGYMGGCTDSINRLYLTHLGGAAVFDPRKGNNTQLEGVKTNIGLIAYYDTLTHNVFTSGLEYPLTNINAIDSPLNRTVYNDTQGFVVSICRDGNQRLRYGTFQEEGYLDEEKGVLVPDTLTERPYKSLISMVLDSTGTLWKGTVQGLFAEDKKGKNRCIETDEIAFVGNYKNKYLIYGSSRTIHFLDLPQYHSTHQISIRSFGYYQGVDILECGQNGYWEDKEGYVWLVGGDKALRFLPDELLKTPEPTLTPPFIASVSYANRQNEWHSLAKDSTGIKLKHTDNFLRFEILQAFTSDPEKLRFRYRLIPYSDTWQYDTNRTFIFQNLPHGNHRLEVQSSMYDQHWSDSVFSSVITIGKPFWLTLPGLLLLFSFFIAGVVLIVLLVKKQVIKSQAKKREIDQLRYRAVRSKYIPHFTGNVLNSINYLIEKDKSQAQKYVVEFSHFSGQTLLNAEKTARSIEEELEYARTYLELEKLRFEDKLEYQFSIAPEVDLKLMIPAMVLQTFCENALKHGLRHKDGVGLIRIEAIIQKNYHIISVEDNGIGRKKAKERRTEGTGEGLVIVEQQLDILYNSKNKKSFMQVIDLYDAAGSASGTRFELHIPSDFMTL